MKIYNLLVKTVDHFSITDSMHHPLDMVKFSMDLLRYAPRNRHSTVSLPKHRSIKLHQPSKSLQTDLSGRLIPKAWIKTCTNSKNKAKKIITVNYDPVRSYSQESIDPP